MGGAGPLCPFELPFDQVDSDHGHRAERCRGEDRAQPDAADSEHGHAVAGLYLGVDHDSGACRQGAAQQRRLHSGQTLRNRRDAALAGHGVCHECGHGARVDGAGCTWIARGRHLRTATADPRHDDALAGLHLIHFGPDLGHGPDTFVPERVRQEAVRTALATHLQQLAVTHAAADHSHQDLPGLKGRDLELQQPQGLVQLEQDGGDGRAFHALPGDLLGDEPVVVAGVANFSEQRLPVIHVHVGQGCHVPFQHALPLIIVAPGVHGDEGVLAGHTLDLP